MVTETLNPATFADPNVYSAVPMVNNGGIEGPFKWLKSKYPIGGQRARADRRQRHRVGYRGREHGPRALTQSLGYKWLYSRDATYTETSFLPDIIKMKNAGVKLVFEPTVTGNLVNTIAHEMKQENLNALLVSGTNAYEKDFSPGSAGNGTLVTGVYALYRGEDAKAVPAVATFDKWVKKIDPTSSARHLHAGRLDQRRALRAGLEGGRTQPDPGRASTPSSTRSRRSTPAA